MARSQLSILIRQCLHQRIPPREFDELLGLAIKKWAPEQVEIVAALVKAVWGFCLDNDPLVSRYLQIILNSQRAHVSDCLHVLILHWQASAKKDAADDPVYSRTLAQILTDLTIIASSVVMTNAEARNCIIRSSRWLLALFRLAANHTGKHSDENIHVLVNVLSNFLIMLLNTTVGEAALRNAEDNRQDPLNVAIRQTIYSNTTDFPDVAMRLLSEAQKHSNLLESNDHDNDNVQVASMAAITFENNIANAQVMPSRVATYTLLHDKLLHAATIDDNALFNYLSTRYAANTALMFNDLLFSSFEALTKPLQAQDSAYRAQCRIFLHNKLPAILAAISTSLDPLPTEQYLQELWNEQSPLANEDNLSALKHFLNICALHRLISTEIVHVLTGEDSNSTTARGLFSKQALLEQVKANANRGPRLVDELVKNDGNAGPISYAISDIMHRYCLAKETQHLKEMATSLVRNPSTLNSIGMFLRPAYFLAPLCRLLDDWSWDEIHGESQPIYEEFGAVLLLILAFKFRLGLSNDEVGITSHSGFMAQYLSSGQNENLLSQMSDTQKDQLGDWIHNLYESEGISDEVTSSCSAKEFYMLVPTLLRQSMTALSLGKLSQERLEGGLDYLLEPFLLPSLLPSFAWLAQAVKKDTKNAMILIRRLAKSPENPETSKLHRTIMEISHGMFTKALGHLPDQSSYSDIYSLFGEHVDFTSNAGFTATDLNAWVQEPGGIISHLQKAISDLLAIPSAGLYQSNLLIAATQVRGASSVAFAMVNLLVQFAASHEFLHMLDLISTIISCTKTPGFSIRNALQLYHSRLGYYSKKGDNIFAQALVHLYRQVELYATALTPQTEPNSQDLNSITGVDLTEINLDDISMDAEMPKQQSDQTMQPDPLAGESLDQMLNDAATMGSLDQYTMNDENLFDMDNYELANLDDLDMSMF